MELFKIAQMYVCIILLLSYTVPLLALQETLQRLFFTATLITELHLGSNHAQVIELQLSSP